MVLAIWICLSLSFLGCYAAASPVAQKPIPSTLDPYPHKPRLNFNPSTKKFKLRVFSDLHYGENPWDDWGPEQDKNSTILMRRVLKEDRPDYVVLNGDLITGENTFRENATSLIDEIVAPLNEAKIPFSSTHGNHDNNVNITHLAEIERERRVAPLSYTRIAPHGVGGEGGPGNYWVPIYLKESDSKPALILWFFDSRGGFRDGVTPLPDWVDSSVADWIVSETKSMERAWGPTRERAALAFVHIPPNRVQFLSQNLNSTKDPGLNADEPLGQGSTQSTFNTTLYGTNNDKPFWDALNANVKNLHAVVSGHDHGNEWCTRDSAKNVVFCFDKHSGYGGYDGEGWGHGTRDFIFDAKDVIGGVDSYIRLEDGTRRAIVSLPALTLTELDRRSRRRRLLQKSTWLPRPLSDAKTWKTQLTVLIQYTLITSLPPEILKQTKVLISVSLGSETHTFEMNDRDSLPSHFEPLRDALKGQTSSKDRDLEFWKEKHQKLDAKLMGLEGELDILLDWAEVLEEQRMKLTQGQPRLRDSSSAGNSLEDTNKIVADYLELGKKCNDLDEMIESLKNKCAESRMECSRIVTKIRSLSPRQKRLGLFARGSQDTKDSLAYGGAESGFKDSIAVAERIMSAESTAVSVGAVVGAFGAGIAYTTIFSATRGRLDLISWAFTCFLIVILSCGALQLFALPPHGQISRIMSMEYVGSAEHRLLSFIVLVGLPMLAGFLLLVLSVAFLDIDAQEITPGSQIAVRLAGYLPVAFLGYFVIAAILIAFVTLAIRLLFKLDFLPWQLETIPSEVRKDYPSILFKVKDKLLFLPGGQGYSTYRKQRLDRSREGEKA